MNFLSLILAPFVAIGAMISGLFVDDISYQRIADLEAQVQMMAQAEDAQTLGASEAIPTTIAFFETTLAAAISSTATTFTLTSATDKDGNTLASSTYAFVIDEGSSNEEIVVADCTGTSCANAIRGVSVLTGTTSVAALKKSHRRGASVKITDAPILNILARIANGVQDVPNTLTYDGTETIATTSNDIVYASWVNSNYADLFNGNTLTGVQYFTNALYASSTAQYTGTTTHYAGALVGASGQCGTASPNTQLCDKAYIDGVAVAGASDANETTKGIVEEATSAEVAAQTDTGGTGAKLFVTPSKLSSAFTQANATSSASTTAYSQATTTFTIQSGQSYFIIATGVCIDTVYSGGAANGVVYMNVDNKTVRQIGYLGADGSSNLTGIPFILTYASSTPAETTVDVRLWDNNDYSSLDSAGCDSLTNVNIDYIVFP